MTLQYQSLVIPEYTNPLTTADAGDPLDPVILQDSLTQLANRVEYVRQLAPLASDSPDQFCIINEDFFSALFIAGEGLHGDFVWQHGGDTGVVAVTHTGGSSKNPGQVVIQVPGNGASDVEYYFQVGNPTSNPYSFDKITKMLITAKLSDNVANVNTFFRAGLSVDNSSGTTGGTDSISLYYLRGLDATHWKLQSRKSGVSSITTLGSMVSNQFARLLLLKNSGGDWDIYFNPAPGPLPAPTITIAAANLPTGNCTFGSYSLTSSADSFIFTPTIDFMGAQSYIGDRSGA